MKNSSAVFHPNQFNITSLVTISSTTPITNVTFELYDEVFDYFGAQVAHNYKQVGLMKF